MKKYIPFRIGKDGFSFLMYKRASLVLVSLLVILIGLFFASAGMGDMKVAPYDVWQAITGNGDAMSNMVVNKFRMLAYFNCDPCRNCTCCSRLYFTRAR